MLKIQSTLRLDSLLGLKLRYHPWWASSAADKEHEVIQFHEHCVHASGQGSQLPVTAFFFHGNTVMLLTPC